MNRPQREAAIAVRATAHVPFADWSGSIFAQEIPNMGLKLQIRKISYSMTFNKGFPNTPGLVIDMTHYSTRFHGLEFYIETT